MKTQNITANDIALLSELQPEGWQNIKTVFERYANSAFCLPIKYVTDNKIVGIGASISHGDVSWLAHIIVHPKYRNRGIAGLITQTLVNELKFRKCKTIYLIATDLGEPVYKKVGFLAETEYLFFKEVKISSSFEAADNIVPYSNKFKPQISSLDLKVSGEDRMIELEQHLKNGFIYQQNDDLKGYFLPTFGEGLIIADSTNAGLELMKLRLKTNDNAAFPIDNLSARNFLYENDNREYKTAKRMRLGAERNWQASNIYNRIGGNIG